MEALLQYLTKSSAVLALFYICFKTLLSKETFFTTKRVYLLLGILGSLLIPFIVIKDYVIVVTDSLVWNDGSVNINPSIASQPPVWNFVRVLIQIYFIGVLFMVLRFIYQSLSVVKLINSGKKKQINGYTHVYVNSRVLPFSFFKYLVYNPALHSTTLETILIHEKEHADQWHSLDILGAQLFLIVQWFNPVAWLYQKEVAQNLEYAADEATANKVQSKKEYQYVLLDLAVGKQNLAIINPFYNSLIKNRIFMLNKRKSNAKNLWKLIPIVPLTVLFVFAFNTKTVAQLVQSEQTLETNVIVIQINKNSTDESLDENIQYVKEQGIDLEFKRIKRNRSGEIISIKAIYENGKGKTSQYAVMGSEPISPFNFRLEIEDGEIIRADFQGTRFISPVSPALPAKPAPHRINRRHKIIKNRKAPKSNIKVRVKKIKNKDSLNTPNNVIFIEDDTNWESLVEEFEWTEEDFEEIVFKLAKKGDSLQLRVKDLDIEGLAESLQINIDSILDNSIFIKDFIIHKDSLQKNMESFQHIGTKMVSQGNLIFVLDDEEEQGPIIIKDGKEIENIEDLRGDEIESISVLKGQEAIEKYGIKGAHGVVEVRGKKKE